MCNSKKSKKIANFLLIVFVYIFVSESQVNASELTLNLLDGKMIGTYLKILRSSEKINIDLAIEKKHNFIVSHQMVPRFGYTKDDIWAKLDVVNSQYVDQNVYFEFKGPIEYIEAFLVDEFRVVQKAEAGMFMRMESETFISFLGYPVIKFTIPPGSFSVYFSEKAVSPHFPIVVYSHDSYVAREKESIAWSAILFGLSVSFLIILVILVIIIRNISSLLLMVSFAGFFLLNGFVTGMFRSLYGVYLPYLTYDFQTIYLYTYKYWVISLSVYLLSLSLFAIVHSGVSNFFEFKFTRLVTSVALASQCLIGIVSFYDIIWAMNLFSVSFNIILIQASIVSCRRACRGLYEEIFTFSGWLVFGVFSNLQLAYYLGFNEYTFFAYIGTIVGFFAVLLLLVLSIILKNRRELENAYRDNMNILRASTVARTIVGTVQMIAHDIKKPFTLIEIFLTHSQYREMPLEMKNRFYTQVKQSTEYVNGLIEDLLAVNSGGVAIREPVDISEIMRAVWTQCELPQDRFELKLELNALETVLVNRRKITRLLTNLLANAKEAMPSSARRIWLIADASKTKETGFIEMRFGNEGTVIAEMEMVHVFERFHTQGKNFGTGLGLAICQEIVHEHGGVIYCQSDVDFGTEFVFTLPVPDENSNL